MKKTLITLAVGFISIIFLDRIRLGNIANSAINKEIGAIMLESIQIGYGLGARLLLVIGVRYFVLSNKFVHSTKNAGLFGGLFGLVTYGVYDFTNIAILKGRTLNMLLLDITRGVIICSLVSIIMWKTKRAL